MNTLLLVITWAIALGMIAFSAVVVFVMTVQFIQLLVSIPGAIRDAIAMLSKRW